MVKKIAVVGLGYVGLPLALALSPHFIVLGFDIKTERVEQLNRGYDFFGEVSKEELSQRSLIYSADPQQLRTADFIIVCVPTPVDQNHQPDLGAVKSATKLVSENLTLGTIIVYESTVYPGVTEEVCVPILEQHSGLRCGIDFKIGYSPERINPGDKEHALDKVTKIVSGMDEQTLNVVDSVYGKITKTHRASSIKVAEAAKVIENIQRDLNIALMNELALIFAKMGLSTKEVLAAAGTKWNFHAYQPGLVGGHCIPVDPYYLTFRAEQLGYSPQVILAGRNINNYMGKHVAELVLKGLNQAKKVASSSTVLLLGLTFKENVKDFRNSQAATVIKELQEFGVKVYGYDPFLDAEITAKIFGIEYLPLEQVSDVDALVLLTPHRQFETLTLDRLKNLAHSQQPVLVDVKARFNGSEAEQHGFIYRTL